MSKNIVDKLKKRTIFGHERLSLLLKCQATLKVRINLLDDFFCFEDYLDFLNLSTTLRQVSELQLNFLLDIDDYLFECCVYQDSSLNLYFSETNAFELINWKNYLEITKQSEVIGWINFHLENITFYAREIGLESIILHITEVNPLSIAQISTHSSKDFYNGIVRLCGFPGYNQSIRWTIIQNEKFIQSYQNHEG